MKLDVGLPGLVPHRLPLALLAALALAFGLLAPLAGPASALPATSPSSVSAAPLAARTAPEPARIFQFNMCGAVTKNGDCPSHGGSGEGTSVPALISSLTDQRSDIVTLNEVCSTQYDAVLAGLRNEGYPMHGSFVITKSGVSQCGGSADFGNAVLSRQAIVGGTTLPLPNPEGHREVRHLLCAETTLRGRTVKACVTHLGTGGEQADQVVKVAGLVNGFLDEGYPVLLGGDFNLRPEDPGLDPLYAHTGGTGRFHEVDETDSAFYNPLICSPGFASCRSGESTLGFIKIDYIFVSDDFAELNGDATTSPVSDHDPLRGEAVVTLSPQGKDGAGLRAASEPRSG